MPSSRALVVKSLDVRRRTEAPHSGEAAMMPEKSGKHDGRTSQPATALECRLRRLPGLALGLSVCLHLAPLVYSRLTFPCLPTQLSFNPSIFHATPQTNSLTCNLTSISFLIRPRLGLVISGVTRFCPLRLPARLPAYTRLGHCYSTRPPHQHHPRVPWPFAFTSTIMSSSEDDQPLGKGTSRAWFHFICLGDAALQSVGLLFD